MHWCPKNHMAESKCFENPPLVLTDLIQTVMWPIRHQRYIPPISIFFCKYNVSEVIQPGAQMTKNFANTLIYSFKYAYSK